MSTDASSPPSEPTLALAPDDVATLAPDPLFIVGVGASAGGLEALERLFLGMPADSGLAFVVIQHLSPDFPSLMDELLARRTSIPIRRVVNGMLVEPNTIYLLPPKTEMILSSGRLLLTEKDPGQSLSLPIDVFFRSLAEDAGERAVGVVLSGTGSDGSRGIRAIHEMGGLVIAQSEETSKFDGMPRSAVETGVVDFVLSPEEIPQTLLELVRHPLGSVLAGGDRLPQPMLGGMDAVLRLLRKSCGIDFAHYKPNMVARRIERRLLLNRVVDLDAYVARLEQDAGELNSLYKDLLIGVTRFFRDGAAFQRLEQAVIPDLLARVGDQKELRVWVAGCATGEEAYSVAMVLSDHLRQLNRDLSLKIFATDVHRESLEIAGAGKYHDASFPGVSPERLERYFTRQGRYFHVTPELRKTVVFAPHNLIKDAPFTKLDLVTCRNLLIYLQPAAQQKAISMFHFGLKTGGVLFLGPSESPGELSDEFETIDPHWKLFRKRRDVRLTPEVPLSTPPNGVWPSLQFAAPNRPRPGLIDTGILRAYDALLERYMPPALLLSDRREVQHCFGGAGRYLKLPDGRQSADVLDMLGGDLKLAVAGVLQRLSKEGRPAAFRGVRVSDEAGSETVDLSARLLPTGPGPSFTLLTFEPCADPESVAASSAAASGLQQVTFSAAGQDHLELVESELRYTKENLQATIEELETSNEELQATNEELVASNEELQSTNEELHSVNEELYTVNAEYQRKISELTQMTDDMDNLLLSTDVGAIFLDRDLCIRKFTPRIAEVFHLLPQDIGRRLDGFSHTMRDLQLLDDVSRVLQSGQRVERQTQDAAGRWHFLRILPYATKAGIDGVVVTLIDIAALKRTEAHLAQLSAIVESTGEAIVGKDLTGKIVSWNKAAERLFGYTAEEVLGQPATILSPPECRLEQLEAHHRATQGEVSQLETRRQRQDGTILDVVVTMSPIRDADGQIVGVSGLSHDISQRKRTERQLARLAVVANRTDNMVVVTDAAGAIEWVNDAFTRVTEYSLSEVQGRKPGELLQGPRTDPNVVARMREHLRRREGFDEELINYSKSGREYWVQVEVRPVFSETGQSAGFVALESDVTARKQAEIEAREAVLRRDRFLAMLSHELRNPLGAVLNASHVLRRGAAENAAVNDACQVIQRQSEHMARLLDDLLDVARVTQGKIQVLRTPLELTSLVEGVVETVRPLVETRRQQLTLDISPEPLWVDGDRVRLQQIQVNLLTNASKYTPEAGRLFLSLRREEGQAVIRVRDTGLGIPPDMLNRVFDLFVQCHDTLDRAEGGMGVGLTLVRALVELHGGTVEAHSPGPGQGSEFVVRLQLVEAPSAMPPPATEPVLHRPRSIVIVEDNADSRQMLQRLLEFEGYQVAAASTGVEGVRLVEATQPEVALIDIGLPEMDGYQVARRLRETLQHRVLLIALTGYGRPEDREAVLAAGFDEHLVKPLDPAALMEALGRGRYAGEANPSASNAT